MPAVAAPAIVEGTYLTNGRVLACVMERKGHILAVEDCSRPEKWFPVRVADVSGHRPTWRVVCPKED